MAAHVGYDELVLCERCKCEIKRVAEHDGLIDDADICFRRANHVFHRNYAVTDKVTGYYSMSYKNVRKPFKLCEKCMIEGMVHLKKWIMEGVPDKHEITLLVDEHGNDLRR